jgi:hypothetical protein
MVIRGVLPKVVYGVWIGSCLLGTGCASSEDARREKLAMQLALSKYSQSEVLRLMGQPDGDTPPSGVEWKADVTAFYWLHQKSSSVYFGFDRTGKMVGYFYAP